MSFPVFYSGPSSDWSGLVIALSVLQWIGVTVWFTWVAELWGGVIFIQFQSGSGEVEAEVRPFSLILLTIFICKTTSLRSDGMMWTETDRKM